VTWPAVDALKQQIPLLDYLQSQKVGIPLTQVAPTCSMRGWLRNTPET